MEKKIISFKGISNVPDDGLNEAGDMSVLLNMRHKGGELVPCQPPAEVLKNIGSVEQALYHANSKYWLFLRADGSLKAYKEDFSNAVSPVVICGEGVKSFAIMGNIVIMNFADRVKYAIWRGKYYEYLGELPAIENYMTFIIDGDGNKELVMTETVVYPDTASANQDKKGRVDKMLQKIYKEEKGFIDRVWFRVAYRLFDGSYLSVSDIKQVSWYGESGRDSFIGMYNDERYLWHSNDSTSNSYTAAVRYFKAEVNLGDEIFEGLEKWKHIISSVDVLTTGSITSFVADKRIGDKYEAYRTRTVQEFEEAIKNVQFYKMAEYDLNGKLRWEIEDTSPSNLAVQNVMTDTNAEIYIPGEAYTYNKLLHIFDYKRKLFKGYSIGRMVCKVSDEQHERTQMDIYTVIETEQGDAIVKTSDILYEQEEPLWYYVYPDYRAYKLIIHDKTHNKWTEYPLRPHPTKNEAYIFNVTMNSANIIFSETEDYDVFAPGFKLATGTEIATPNLELYGYEQITNSLKVSAVDNPFYFPTAQTYKFEGEIKGLASNAEAISPGQFGQFPLYVFTDTGIWAMQVDTSGQGAYVTQSPFSREVCNGAICPVSGGVVFATDKGVMAISGGQVTDLSAVLDGFEVDFFKYNAEMWNAIFAKAGKEEVVNPVPIREYIKGAVIAYNYHYNEIVVSNKALFKEGEMPYSYVYSLTNRVWSVIDTVFDLTTNKYPELVVFDKQGKMFTFADGGSGIVPVVAITRPFTLGSFDFKRLRQAALRTTFEGSLNFYLLGSNDGAVFKCITGKEVEDSGTCRDLITAMSRSKQYKYFAIAIAGQMSGRVSMAELLVDAGFANNKIR
jgi:hypothetical protein